MKKNEQWPTNIGRKKNGKTIIMASPYSGVQYSDKPHRWIMEMLMGRKLKSTEVVHHKDFNHKNNSLYPLNLKIMNISVHSTYHLLRKHPRTFAKLTKKEVDFIRKNSDEWGSQTKLAKLFNISTHSISMIVRNKTYRHFLFPPKIK